VARFRFLTEFFLSRLIVRGSVQSVVGLGHSQFPSFILLQFFKAIVTVTVTLSDCKISESVHRLHLQEYRLSSHLFEIVFHFGPRSEFSHFDSQLSSTDSVVSNILKLQAANWNYWSLKF
jgi:hypothetical protein